MNDVIKTITERYSCRDFADTPLSDDQLKTLALAAAASPSAMNRQPWRINIITDKAIIGEMDENGMSILAAADDKSMHERIMSRGGKLFYNAPCMILVLSNTDAALDCGIVCQNIVLAAHSLGLGSVIVGMAGVPLAGNRGDEFKKRLKFPEGYDFAMGVLVGTPKSGKEPHEPDLSKITYVT